MLTPALYRTRITHLRRAPVHHYFEHRSYSWYIDIDALPDLPRWLQPFARFEASDHLDGEPNSTLRQRVERFLAERDIDLGGGKITALLQARVLGYVFNPLTLYWCHDADGVLQHVIAEVHNTYGGRHAYLLPPDSGQPAMVMKKLYVSPFNDVSGYYLVRAPRPDSELDVTISLHRENQPAFVATMRGERRRAGIGQILRLQLAAPLAPLMSSAAIRAQGITLWLRRVPVVPRPKVTRDLAAGEVLPRARPARRKGSSSCERRYRPACHPADQRRPLAGCGAGSVGTAQPDCGADRRAPVPQCRGAPAAAHGLSRRLGRRRRRPDTADDGDSSPRRAGATDRPLRPHRFRRVLHGGRVELRRPGGCAHRVRAVDGQSHSPVASVVPADRRCPPTAFAVQQPRTGSSEHLRALRSVQ